MTLSSELKQSIDDCLAANPVVLYMKGNAEAPMCGFSSRVVQILQHLNINFKDVDVMSSMDLRQGIKEYSEWPTIPQLYIKGEFIGGCDIVTEMFQSGELKTLLEQKLAVNS